VGQPAVPEAPWDVFVHARLPTRPSGLEWAGWLCEEWTELRGPDRSVRAGIARISGRRVVVVLNDRHFDGSSTTRPGPGAYRLVQRALRVAERLGLAVLTVVDMPGAEPGPAAEADGIAGEIARTLLAAASLRTPSVALCVGEGGSGGAMALAHADRFLMLDGAVFEVIGPEAGAAVLFRDGGRGPELAEDFALTAPDLLRMGVVDGVIEETQPDAVRAAVLAALSSAVPGERDARADRLSRAYLNDVDTEQLPC
jgi:acyl-CoA carboxylase subunit beta